jgi:hypothetical protein
LHQCSAEGHASNWRQRFTRHTAGESRLRRGQPDLAIHFPAHRQQQDAAGKRQSNNREQLRRHDRKQNSQNYRAGHAPEDDADPQRRVDPRRRHTYDDGVVAGQDEIDDEDLRERD